MKKIIIITFFLSSIIFPRKVIVKMATLAPEGTSWHGMLVEIGQQWKEITKGKVQLRIYPGGVLGDERDMVRKMRIGQIHAAAMTAEGLSEIVDDFSAYFVPFVYESPEDIRAVTDYMLPSFDKKLDSKGFKLLYLGELTWVYWFSKEPIYTPSDLKNKKFFTWAGNFVWEQIWKEAGYNPVALASTDILSSLQTGLINSIPMPPIYALAQQTFSLANHMTDLKYGVLIAGVVIDGKTWNRIPDKYQDNLKNVVNSMMDKYSVSNRKAESDAIVAMKQYGLNIHKPSIEQQKLWEEEFIRITPFLRGVAIPENIFDKVIELTKD